jgi:hypothetical protein
MLPQKPVPEPAWAVFDHFGEDRAAERERCRRRRDQSIVVLTAEARRVDALSVSAVARTRTSPAEPEIGAELSWL